MMKMRFLLLCNFLLQALQLWANPYPLPYAEPKAHHQPFAAHALDYLFANDYGLPLIFDTLTIALPSKISDTLPVQCTQFLNAQHQPAFNQPAQQVHFIDGVGAMPCKVDLSSAIAHDQLSAVVYIQVHAPNHPLYAMRVAKRFEFSPLVNNVPAYVPTRFVALKVGEAANFALPLNRKIPSSQIHALDRYTLVYTLLPQSQALSNYNATQRAQLTLEKQTLPNLSGLLLQSAIFLPHLNLLHFESFKNMQKKGFSEDMILYSYIYNQNPLPLPGVNRTLALPPINIKMIR